MQQPNTYRIHIKIEGPDGGVLETTFEGISRADAEEPNYMLAPVIALYGRYILNLPED